MAFKPELSEPQLLPTRNHPLEMQLPFFNLKYLVSTKLMTLKNSVPLFPLVMVLQLVLTLGVGLLLSVGAVYFRDMNHWVNASLLLLMFLTPVVYPAAVYPRQYSLLLQLNPLAHLVGLYRELLLNGALPHPHSIIIVMVTSCVSLLIGYSVFHHHQRRLADVV